MPLADLITEEIENQELERAKDLSERWKIYEGEHPDSLPVTKGNSSKPDVNDNVKYNISRLTVDKGVSFLFGGIDQEITFALEENTEPVPTPTEGEGDAERPRRTSSPLEEWLEMCWVANQKKTLLSNIGTNGGVCGHFFARLYEDGAIRGRKFPRIVNLDPAYCTPIWKEDDYQVVLGYKIQFPVRGGKKIRRTLIEPKVEDITDFDWDDVDGWIITDQQSEGGRTTALKSVWSDIGEPLDWDFPFAPIVDGQNLPAPNSYWGYGDLEGGLVDMNLALNRALSSMQRILRLHGHPKPWVAGVTPEQIQILAQGVDRIITLPENAVLNQLEMSGDLAPMVEFFRQLKTAFHEQAKNPQVDPDKLGSVGGLSGLALRILYQPLLEQTGTKRGTYGDFLLETNRRLLALGSKEIETPVNIGWPDPLPQDIKEAVEAYSAARQLGLSQETALERIGEDPQLEEERRARDTAPVAGGLEAILNSPAFNGGTAT